MQIMGDEQHRELKAGLQAFEELQNLLLNRYVEGRHRLVRNQDVRLQSKGTGNPDALTLSALEYMGNAVGGTTVEADELQEIPSPVQRLPSGNALCDRSVCDRESDPASRIE